MYIRRKVFSLGEGNIDYDYNIYQQLYSEAFDDGVDYAIEKMFGSGDEPVKSTKGRLWGLLGTGSGGNAAYLVGRHSARNGIREGDSDAEILKRATISGALAGAGNDLVMHGAGARYKGRLIHDIVGTGLGVYGARKNAKEEIKARHKH